MSSGIAVGVSGALAGLFDGFELDALRGYAATFSLFSPGQFVIAEARHPIDGLSPGMAPYVQVLALTPDMYVMEVPGNGILCPPFELTVRQEDVLARLGFAAPYPDDKFPGGEKLWRYVFEFVEIPSAAAVIVCVLADVFALPVVSAASVVGSGNTVGCPEPCLHALGWHGTG